MRLLIQSIAIVAFVLAGGHFSHAVEHSHAHGDASGQTLTGSFVPDADDTLPQPHAVETVHCGALVLTLINCYEVKVLLAGLRFDAAAFQVVSDPLIISDLPPPRG